MDYQGEMDVLMELLMVQCEFEAEDDYEYDYGD